MKAKQIAKINVDILPKAFNPEISYNYLFYINIFVNWTKY